MDLAGDSYAARLGNLPDFSRFKQVPFSLGRKLLHSLIELLKSLVICLTTENAAGFTYDLRPAWTTWSRTWSESQSTMNWSADHQLIGSADLASKQQAAGMSCFCPAIFRFRLGYVKCSGEHDFCEWDNVNITRKHISRQICRPNACDIASGLANMSNQLI